MRKKNAQNATGHPTGSVTLTTGGERLYGVTYYTAKGLPCDTRQSCLGGTCALRRRLLSAVRPAHRLLLLRLRPPGQCARGCVGCLECSAQRLLCLWRPLWRLEHERRCATAEVPGQGVGPPARPRPLRLWCASVRPGRGQVDDDGSALREILQRQPVCVLP